MEGRVWRGFKYNGNKKEASNCHRLSGIEGDFIESEGWQRTVQLEHKKREKEEEKNKGKIKGYERGGQMKSSCQTEGQMVV